MGANWSSSMVLPPGCGFHPSNEVLIKDYLRPKIMGKNVPEVDIFIPTIDDLCNSDPSELLSLCRRPWNRDHCYFFCKWKLYGKGTRCDRKTKTGHWKKTGKELDIFDPNTHKCIGKRSILVLYEGRNPGHKTDYIIHLYEMNDGISHQSAPYVICRLHVDANKMKKTKNKIDTPSNMESEPSGKLTSDLEIQGEPAVIPQNHFFNGGEPSVNITSNGDVPLAIADTKEEYDQARAGFESVDSEQVYSSERHHNEYVDTELSIAELMGKFCVPQDGSGGTRDGVFNDQPTSKETAGFPDMLFLDVIDGGEPSVNITFDVDVPLATADTLEKYDEAGAGFESVGSEPVYSSEGHHNGYVDTELSIVEFMGMFYVPQDGSGGMRDGVFHDQPTSTETTDFPNMLFLDVIDGGEPSVNITSDGDVPLATANTLEEYDQAGEGFESVDSEPVYSSEGHHNGYVDTELSTTELMDMFYVPQDGFGGTRDGVFNDQPTSTETEGFPDMLFLDVINGGEPSVNITSDSDVPLATANTLEEYDQVGAGFELVDSEPVYSSEGHHNGYVDTELYTAELMDMFYVTQDGSGGTRDGVFNDQPTSTETAGFPDMLFLDVINGGEPSVNITSDGDVPLATDNTLEEYDQAGAGFESVDSKPVF